MTVPPTTTQARAEPAGAAPAIVKRATTLTASEQRRLGRWASTTFRDPRTSVAITDARERGQAFLSSAPDRKKRWQRISAPLYEGFVAAASEDRRYRLVMLFGHLIAILAVVNVPSGLPIIVAAVLVLAAPVSAWLAWGRATAWLGAIDAALGAELVDRLDENEVEVLQRAWRNSIVEVPPVSPPLIGVVSAFLPSLLLVAVLVVVAVANLR
ncbi:MAG TPA: hypothetical protein VFV72_15745 [Candidatus Limnocylindrales bacterium]|nr:hypothetical protein [Candidatus Limnocylindrales bacterium]